MKAEDLYYYTASIGIFAAGVWATWRFTLDERRRRWREIYSLEGSIEGSVLPLDEHQAAVTVTTRWKNTCIFPIEIDANATSFKFFRILSQAAGPIHPGSDVFKSTPLAGRSGILFEPATESLVVSHAILEAGLYLVRCDLEARNRPNARHTWHWTYTREILVSIE